MLHVHLSTATVEVLLLAFAAVCRVVAPLLLGTWRYAASQPRQHAAGRQMMGQTDRQMNN